MRNPRNAYLMAHAAGHRRAEGFSARTPAGMPERLARVVQMLGRLPGVGEKTALRYALFLVTGDEAASRDLGRELAELRDFVRPCERCGNIAEGEHRWGWRQSPPPSEP